MGLRCQPTIFLVVVLDDKVGPPSHGVPKPPQLCGLRQPRRLYAYGSGGYPDQGCSGPKGTWEFCQWVQVQIVRDLQTGYRRNKGDQWEPEVGPRRWAAKPNLCHLSKPIALPVFNCEFD